MDALLGVDVGTTNTTAVAYSLRGGPLAEPVSRPTVVEGRRRAYQRPEDLWAAAGGHRGRRRGTPPEARLLGMTVASVGEASVPLDARGSPSIRSSPGTTSARRRSAPRW